MAAQTRPQKIGVALASAAAIVAASPAVAPHVPTPTALSSAAYDYDLTTFADLLSIPTEEWTNTLFSNTSFGGYIGPWLTDGEEYVGQSSGLIIEPWATSCFFDCFLGGISGVAYLAAAALVNGNGLGWEGRDNWSVGIVNYLFEPFFQTVLGSGQSGNFAVQTSAAGLSAATEYLLQATIGGCTPVEDGGGPCTPPGGGYPFGVSTPTELIYPNPIGQAIAYAFFGPYLLTVAYDTALATVAGLITPFAPFVADSITAYLGDLLTPGSTIEDPIYYQPGLSGVLNFWVDAALGVYTPPTPSAPAAPDSESVPADPDAAPPLPPDENIQPAAAVAVAAPQSATEAAVPESPAEAAEAAVEPAEQPVEPSAESARDAAQADAAPAQPADEAAGDTDATPAAEPAAAAEKSPRRGLRGAVEKAAATIASGVEQAKAGAARGRKALAAAE